MPITHLRLKNFKCFADSGPIPLAPLTVIFGRNNAGKSSILQSMLLMRQTLDAPDFGPRLNLRGPLYSAGSYPDIVHQHRASQHIVMDFGIESKPGKVSEGPGKADISMEFCSDEPQAPPLTRLRVKIARGHNLEVCRGRGAGGPYSLKIDNRALGGKKQAQFVFPINRWLPLIGPEPARVGRPSTSRLKVRGAANEVFWLFQAQMRHLKAVGAFRTQPSRRYEYQGRTPDLVDLAGENVVNALIEDASSRKRNRGELLKGLNRWLESIGRVRLQPLRRISSTARIFELRLRDTDSGRWANFADVGFGIGQALPVLVEGLRTPADGIFLVQEPEIHLHPDAQLGIGDFLVELARTGRQVIVETHSENLLLRVRRSV
jgi:hypothetical protein